MLPIHPEDPNLRFPLVKDELETPEQMVQNLFNEYVTGKQDWDSNKAILNRPYETSWKTDSISCHYTELIRLKCPQNEYPTLIQVWKATSPKILRSFANVDQAREYLFSKGGRECNYFSPGLCLRLYLEFNDSRYPIKIIDPSAGWGDRMISAIAAGDFVSQYDGYDPNKDLIEPYRKIIYDLDHTNKCRFFCQEFEKAEVPKEYYDLGLTSPPYFDLEIYSKDNAQSVSEGKTNYGSWLERFYKPYLKNLSFAIRKEGKIIIYVSNFYSKKERRVIDLEEQTVKYLEKELGSCKLIRKGGLMNSNGKIRPLFVFNKLN